MPIRIGVSPRAWMMNGEAICSAPSAVAPFRRVRRSNFGMRIVGVMSFPRWIVVFIRHCEERSEDIPDSSFRDGAPAPDPESLGSGFDASHRSGTTVLLASLAMTVLSLASPDALGTRRSAVCCRPSSWPLNLAAGGLGRSGGFLAGHGVFHGEHVVGIALRRV